MTTAILELDTIRAGYNDAIAIENISLTVGRGEVVCLLGANGAGKTTTMRVVTGLIPLLSGAIRYNGEDISHMPAHERVTAGICLSPEGRQVFPDLTVMENLSLGSFNRRARPNRKQSLERVLTLFPKLHERRSQAAGLMSGGEQQMLAIGRAHGFRIHSDHRQEWHHHPARRTEHARRFGDRAARLRAVCRPRGARGRRDRSGTI
jgi:branched-chain amino acid transport system ATP-binding protein